MKRNWILVLALASAASLGACSTMGGEESTGASSSGGYGAGIEPHGTAGSSPYGGGESPSKSGSEGGYTNEPSNSDTQSSGGIYNRNTPAEGGVTNEPRDTTGTSQYPGAVTPDGSSGSSESGGSGSGNSGGGEVVGPTESAPGGVTNEPRDTTGTSQYPGSVTPDQSNGSSNE